MEENILTKKGYKNTKTRKAILDVLEESDGFLSAEEIYLHAKQVHASLNLSTVYRTLDLLKEKDMLVKIMIEDGKARYQIKENEHHHHLICLNCYKKVPLEYCPLQEMEKELKDKTDFEIINHRLELYGLCPECQK